MKKVFVDHLPSEKLSDIDLLGSWRLGVGN
jgi:hypothetical protein